MHHHHEGKAALRIHVAEELLQRPDAAGGRAKPYDRCWFLRIAPFPCTITRVLGRLVSGGRIERFRGWRFYGHQVDNSPTILAAAQWALGQNYPLTRTQERHPLALEISWDRAAA